MALLRSQVTVAGKPAEDDAVSLGYLTADSGPIYPFFTSQHVYWGSVAVRSDLGPENLVMPAGTLMEMTRGQRLVLNPDGPFDIIFEPDDIEQLLTVGDLPADRGTPQMAGAEVLDQLELEHLATQVNRQPAAIASLRDRVLATDLLLLGSTGDISAGLLPAGGRIDAVVLTDEQGPICPVYSSEHMVRATMAAIPNLPAQTVKLRGADIVELTAAPRYVLNPHGPAPFFFDA